MYNTVDSADPMADIEDPITKVLGPFNFRFPHMRGATLACYVKQIPSGTFTDEAQEVRGCNKVRVAAVDY